jgi:hypothetical protein
VKIQLDTENKTITIEEDINLHDFHEQINILLPGGLWREFTLKVGKIKKWEDPIVVDPYKPPNIDQPWNPVQPNPNPYPGYPQIWYTTTTDNIGRPIVEGGDYESNLILNNGTFNVEFK